MAAEAGTYPFAPVREQHRRLLWALCDYLKAECERISRESGVDAMLDFDHATAKLTHVSALRSLPPERIVIDGINALADACLHCNFNDGGRLAVVCWRKEMDFPYDFDPFRQKSVLLFQVEAKRTEEQENDDIAAIIFSVMLDASLVSNDRMRNHISGFRRFVQNHPHKDTRLADELAEHMQQRRVSTDTLWQLEATRRENKKEEKREKKEREMQKLKQLEATRKKKEEEEEDKAANDKKKEKEEHARKELAAQRHMVQEMTRKRRKAEEEERKRRETQRLEELEMTRKKREVEEEERKRRETQRLEEREEARRARECKVL